MVGKTSSRLLICIKCAAKSTTHIKYIFGPIYKIKDIVTVSVTVIV
jgi:hypothetical protein